jgi:CheY-like chemotaxis protein
MGNKGKQMMYQSLCLTSSRSERAGEKPRVRAKHEGCTHHRELIVFVDDEEAWPCIAERILSKVGYGVIGFTNPLEALDFCRKHPTSFDLVITDLNMPELNGLELAARLLELRPSLPIILTTASASAEALEWIDGTRLRRLLQKSAVVRRLAQTVATVLAEAKSNNR